ncbi:hypothetical protein FPOAC1_007746 [Fusarium poae]|uniref:hypothetical protein n=1 Tax=Fusarium poae TaxID=36050 RepID=UPI001CEA931F|nr:hypothetical protein FPOAC1_007746 [Fusarium poae]KAG8668367.1 hypothetical protein FPOAC1_007746 [Fusarium poae]
MHDEKSHDIPYVPCPTVGPYNNFELLPSLGVRVEYWDSLQEWWFSIPLQCAFALTTVMVLFQVLQGVTFTGDPNGFEKSPYMIAKRVIQLEFVHRKQTCRWVE